MKAILDVSAIRPPLTGIGRYAWELAQHFRTSVRLDDVRYFSNGYWINDPAELLSIRPYKRSIFLSGTRWLRQHKLTQRLSSHLFHSPNYFLPQQVDGGIITVHDLSVFKYPETHPPERIRHFEHGFVSTLARTRHIITDSEATRQEVADYFGWSTERITAIPLGVGPDFYPRASSTLMPLLSGLGLTPGRYALCVSTLEPRKRITDLIEAYRRIPEALRTQYPLILVGSNGWLSDKLLEQIRMAEQEGWLRYLGYVSEDNLPALYAGARAFFFPSVYEGFGLPILESLASGVPTLASNESPIRDIICNATWLTNPDDHDAFVCGITHVLENESWRSVAIDLGLEIAGRLDWKSCADRTIDLYQRIAGR